MKKAKAKTQSFLHRLTKSTSDDNSKASNTTAPPSITVSQEHASQPKTNEPTLVSHALENNRALPELLTPEPSSPTSNYKQRPPSVDYSSRPGSVYNADEGKGGVYRTPNASSSTLNLDDLTVDADLRMSRIMASVSDLNSEVAEFRKNYAQFAAKNREYILIENYLGNPDRTIEETAQAFGDRIWAVIHGIESKKDVSKKKWTTKLVNFCSKLYPVAGLSLDLASTILNASPFSPLGGAASGLGIILQILEDESGRGDDFFQVLRRIEFEAAILADNPNYDLEMGQAQSLLQEKSTQLMTAIIKFFNSALIYFSKGFFANLLTTIVDGQKQYEDGKSHIDTAIRDYDQTVIHLTARIVAETKYQQNLSMRQKQDEEFLQWLSPSYWLVDSKLHGMRDKRKKGTLKWAHDMVQFQNWRLSQLSESSEASKERILWLRGPLGIGKSIMAGYFIDLLKCLYPNAIVAYFFCRFKESGLEKAHDIIRTLAYQCIENNPAGRYALESLKRKNFVISDSLGVAYLFEKLILDALRTCQKDVYIVIDGLDEADRTTVDKSDRLETPELHILLKCLLKLHSSRILIISRPIADISNVLQNVTVRDIGDENRQDIETYVRDYLDTNKSLRAQFKNVKVNPLNYFQEKANGVFLWVVLVVEQLAKTKSQSQFQKYLDGFSEASGSMEKLYSTILSKFSEEDKKWAAEIIKWLVATKGGISIKYLQDGVEWCLKDKLVDFHEFVQVDCGSILQKSESSVDPWTYPWTFERKTIYFVQLIHKTFREFVIDAERCPPMFYVDEKEANRQIALEGIRRLNSADLTFINYHWFNTWVDHLDKTATNDRSDEVLVALYQFFNSHGVRNWIKYGIQSTGPESVETPENRPLNTVLRWIRGCTISQQVEAAQGIEQNTEMGDRGSYMKWHLTILSDRSVLGDLVGKAAAIIWLHDQTANYRSVCNSFYIALKYYQRRKGSYLSNLEELNRLKSTDFSDIVVWAGSNETVLKRNLGVAYFTIYQWDDCIRCLNDPETLNDPDFRFRLGLAYLSKGDFDNALKSMQGSTHAYKNCPSLVETFGAVYIGSGKFDEAIAIIKPLLEATEYSFSPWILYTLVEIYYAKGEYASAIETLLAASEQDPDSVEIWWRIFELCKDSGNVAKFFEAALLTLRKHPNITSIWIVFWVANTELGDNDEAIQSLECSNEQPAELNIGLFHQYLVKGRFDQVFRLLFEAGTSLTTWRGFIHEAIWNKCKKTGKYDEAIGALKLVMENCLSESHDSYLLSWLLGDLYMAKGEYDNAIAVFDAAADENDSEINKAIFRAFVAKGDYDRAMKVFEPIVDTVVSYDQFWRSGLLEVYQKRNDFEGAIKTFERIIRNPNHSDDWSWAWSGLFEAYTKKGDQCGAIKRVDRAVKERGLLSPSWMEYDILDAYKAIDNVDAGIERLETILNDRPLDLWSRYALADAYRAKGDFNKALGLYQSSLELVPFDYMYLIQIGETHLAKSEYKAAIESYERAIDIHSRQRKMFSKPFPSILCAYLKMSRNSTDVFDWQIPIDNTFPQHFLWHSLGSAYEALSNSQAARDVYETALGCYKNVLKNDGSLLWEYSFHGFYSVRALDVFEWKQPMPKEALWSVLGELYKMRGDDAKALEAFQEAIVLKPENKWLNEMIDELKTRESIRQDT